MSHALRFFLQRHILSTVYGMRITSTWRNQSRNNTEGSQITSDWQIQHGGVEKRRGEKSIWPTDKFNALLESHNAHQRCSRDWVRERGISPVFVKLRLPQKCYHRFFANGELSMLLGCLLRTQRCAMFDFTIKNMEQVSWYPACMVRGCAGYGSSACTKMRIQGNLLCRNMDADKYTGMVQWPSLFTQFLFPRVNLPELTSLG